MTDGKDDEEAAASEVECVRILLCVDALNLKTCYESTARDMENGSLEAAPQTPFRIYLERLGDMITYCNVMYSKRYFPLPFISPFFESNDCILTHDSELSFHTQPRLVTNICEEATHRNSPTTIQNSTRHSSRQIRLTCS